MTEPRDMQRELQAEAAADPEPEVKPELIQDLDVTDDDVEVMGGCVNSLNPKCGMTQPPY